MAKCTLKAKYKTLDRLISRTHAILCHSKNVKEIYYQYEDEVKAPPTESASDAAPSAPAAAAAAPAIPVTVAAPTSPVVSIEDVPVKVINILLIIIAQKLKKQIDEIPLSKTIKDLVGGKLMLQNEILGDLQQEFALAPKKGEELPLKELGSALGSGFNGSLGKYSTGLISCLVSGKMPGGFNASSIKGYLTKTWSLGPSRSDGVLLLATTLEPPKRLASEVEAKTWLDGIISVYTQQTGILFASLGAAGAGGSRGGSAVINSEEFLVPSRLGKIRCSTCQTVYALPWS